MDYNELRFACAKLAFEQIPDVPSVRLEYARKIYAFVSNSENTKSMDDLSGGNS